MSSRQEKFWDKFSSWSDAENAWEEQAALAATRCILKVPPKTPCVPAIMPEDARWLRWKALSWVIHKDARWRLVRSLLRHPFKYGKNYLHSLLSRQRYARDGDFLFFGCNNIEAVHALMKSDDVVFVVGFSYCMKPHECPSSRFSSDCLCDLTNDVCRQCFIGKCRHALPSQKTIPLVILTINDIGKHMLSVIDAFPKARVVFLITACEMALEMFGDFGNMVGIQGVGVRLSGRFCNTMKAFELSEEGVKPGLTFPAPKTKRRILDLLRYWRELS